MSRLTRQFDFTGASGHRLSGRLDLPSTPPQAVALFAHCFTCNKDYHASTRISRGLAERGFAVLRFDFTGLGNSDGDFANTDFSANVADLVAAARAVGEAVAPPRLLIGHSLGGTAVLRAALELPSVGAISVINAPASPTHLRTLIAGREAELTADGVVHVRIGGRDVPLSREFLGDLDRHPMEELLPKLQRPVLVLHDPEDPVVSVAEADQLLSQLPHPRAFVPLVGAGHLVARPEDAVFVAESIALWARRALALPDASPSTLPGVEPGADHGTVTVAETGEGPLANLVDAGGHMMRADEPPENGGGGTGPDPYQLLLSALGACTSMTVRLYADRKGWPLERIAVQLTHRKEPAPPGVETENAGNTIDRITRALTLTGPLDDEQRDRLLEIAGKCPVHRTLMSTPEIKTTLLPQDGDAGTGSTKGR